MNIRKYSRLLIIGAALVAVAFVLFWSFAPRPVPVDFGEVLRRDMTVTIDEEARTRVHDSYMVSAPIGGRLLRVDAEAGDEVIGGETVIARMRAAPPSVIDRRTREQAEAAVRTAQAALEAARSDFSRVRADLALAESDLTRLSPLADIGAISRSDLDLAERQKRAADAAVDTARATISAREAELAQAQALLIEFRAEDETLTSQESSIPIIAPITGRVLRVVQESETLMTAGQSILEIGDVAGDLEILAELLSTDAVQVSVGDRVIISNWGGPEALDGVVSRIEPWGFTKYSALGVEEQRVNTIIRFTSSSDLQNTLGHGYRVEVGIVIWESDETLTVPSSALFRDQAGWAVFVVEEGKARLVRVDVSQNNGDLAAIRSGLSENATVILYPGPAIEDGTRVTERSGG